MKNTYILLASVFAMGFSVATQAQTRYLDDIGTDISVTSNVNYGNNVGILTQTPALEALVMDVYQLEGDTTSNKPVVIMLHTGSFLPAIVNGQATGDKSDNAIVEMCERFAKKGYLAIALNYRLGWNPVSDSEDVRRSTLIQAAYRSLQDVKTAVRFLRKSVAEEDNPYGVGNAFAVGGYGTGGYISLSLATLNDYNSELLMPKFIDSSAETIALYGQPVPYIVQSVLGNFDATDYGMLPYDSDGDGIPDIEVPLCVPNHVGYSSEIDMAFNAGGALPDISWLDEGEVPIASMQCITDPDAPYAEGNVIVPTTGEFVITAHGAQWVQETADSLGNNELFNELSTTLTDSWYNNGNGAANATIAGHDDLNGLFGIVTPTPSVVLTACGLELEQGAPWDWWDNATYGAMADGYHGTPTGTMGCLALLGNPDMSEEKGMAMADMMSEFFTPRVYAALLIYGCTDENTCNYNEDANYNDGSCISFDVELSNSTSIEIPLTVTTTTIAPTYSWTLNGDSIEGSSSELLPTGNGEYVVFVTNGDGCTITASQNVALIIYGCTDENTCNYNADANEDDGSCISFDVEISTLTIEEPLTVTTTAIVPTYSWTLNGDTIEGSSSELLPTENGEYVVTVTDVDGCAITASQNVANVSLIELISEQVNIYPNPANNFITISAQNPITAVKLYAVEGKLLRTYTTNTTTVSIEKNELTNGLYFIELEINKQTIKKSVVFN